MAHLRFLLDANLSPETATFLRSFGFDTVSLLEGGLSRLEDEAVARLAIRQQRILVTFDLDFGELYYFSSEKRLSVIVLRLDDQRVEAVNAVLEKFLNVHAKTLGGRKKRLAIVTETEVRTVE